MRKLLIGLVLSAGGLAMVALQAGPTSAEYPPPAGTTAAIVVSDISPSVGGQVSIAVTLTDPSGAPIADADCTLAIVSQPSDDASLEATSVTTNANGVATTTLNIGSASGAIVIGSTCGDVQRSITVVASETEAPADPPASLPDSLPPAGSGPSMAPGTSNAYTMPIIIILIFASLVSLLLVRRMRADQS
jgi:hypothetical protein